MCIRDRFINIIIKIEGTQLELTTANNSTTVQYEESGGLGLKNLRKRLELLYPNRHKYSFKIEDNVYHAYLSLNLAP